MDPGRFTRVDATTWRIGATGAMRVPAIIYSDEQLIRDMDNMAVREVVAEDLAGEVTNDLATSEKKVFSSACHGAGRALSRHAALKQWSGRQVVDDLAKQGIFIRSPSQRGVAEEAPRAYKEVGAVVEAAQSAGLARRVARLRPVICIKG